MVNILHHTHLVQSAMPHPSSCATPPVVSAAWQFYTAQTLVNFKTHDGSLQQRITAPLHSVTDPEEKRQIIGDTFMKVGGVAWVWFLSYNVPSAFRLLTEL